MSGTYFSFTLTEKNFFFFIWVFFFYSLSHSRKLFGLINLVYLKKLGRLNKLAPYKVYFIWANKETLANRFFFIKWGCSCGLNPRRKLNCLGRLGHLKVLSYPANLTYFVKVGLWNYLGHFKNVGDSGKILPCAIYAFLTSILGNLGGKHS